MQAEEPLIVYMGKDLSDLLSDLMTLFIESAVMKENKSGYKLATVDVTKNQLPGKKVNIGHSARHVLDTVGMLF